MRLIKVDTVDMLKERRSKRKLARQRIMAGIPLEHDEQASLIEWKYTMERQIPELTMLFAIPGQGVARLKNLQVEGYQRGIPDLFLATPRARTNGSADYWHGLFIELKRRRGGKPSSQQYSWLEKLSARGYQCVVAYGWDEARKAILGYLGREAI